MTALRALLAAFTLSIGLPGVAAAQVIIEPPTPCPWWHCGGPARVAVAEYRVDVVIDDGLATTKVTQVLRNDSDFVGEGTFLHPIPADAAVTGLTLWIDGEPVSGELLDGESARRTYEDIVRRTLDPALLEYAGDGLLRLSVFPIAPHETRRVEIEYRQILPADGGLVRYRHPLGREHGATIETVVARVEIRSGAGVKAVYSPSHSVSVDRRSDQVAIVGFEGTGTAWSDFVLYHSTGAAPMSVDVLSHRDGTDGYFVLLASPGLGTPETIVPKDVVIVLDVSGSMEGEKLDQAQAAAGYVLSHLNDGDRFDVIAFSTGVDSYGDGLRSRAEAATAALWVDRLAAGGATNIDLALTTALDRADASRPTYVVFLTDGLPTEGIVDTADILDRLDARRRESISIFAFGVGWDVDTFLLDSIARAHHGTTSYVVPGEAIDAAVESWYGKVASPVLTGVTLDVNGVTVSDLHPLPLPDVFRGGQMVVAGRYDGSGPATVVLRGSVGGEPIEITFPEVSFTNEGGDPAVPRVWASRKIGELLRSMRLDGPNQETIDQIVRLSIRWGIVTPYTSYLVADDAPLGASAIDEASRAALRDATTSMAPSFGEAAVGAADAAADLAAAQAGSGVAAEYSALVRLAGARTFRLVDGVWTDTAYEPGSPVVRVAFGSEDHFALAGTDPLLAAALSVGARAIVVWGSATYEVVPSDAASDPIPTTTVPALPTTLTSSPSAAAAVPPPGAGTPVVPIAVAAALVVAAVLARASLRRD